MAYSYGKINRLYKDREVRKDYREAGNTALKRFGLTAKYKDQFVFIQFVSRPLIGKDEYEFLMDKELNPTISDEVREQIRLRMNWGYEACFGLELEEIPKKTFKGVHLGKWIVLDDGKSVPDDRLNITKEEYFRGMEIIEAYMEAIMADSDA